MLGDSCIRFLYETSVLRERASVFRFCVDVLFVFENDNRSLTRIVECFQLLSFISFPAVLLYNNPYDCTPVYICHSTYISG